MNKYRINDNTKRIDYFATHWYKIDGIDDPLPSVTKVINDVIAKGYGYDEWLKTSGHEANYVLREAQESGSKIHAAIESLILGSDLHAVGISGKAEDMEFTEREWKKINDWLNWYQELNIEPVLIEQMIYSKSWGVAGTADFICKIDGKVYLIDWKTGNNIYETANLQIAAYASMFNETYSEKLGFKIEAGLIVHVGALNKTKKEFSNKGVKGEIVDIAEDAKTFEQTLAIWKRLYPDVKAPTSEYPLTLKLTKGVLKVEERNKN